MPSQMLCQVYPRSKIVAKILPAPSRNNIINTSKDSPKQANILHSIPYNNHAGNLTWPPGPFNITTAKCSNSISEVGSKG